MAAAPLRTRRTEGPPAVSIAALQEAFAAIRDRSIPLDEPLVVENLGLGKSVKPVRAALRKLGLLDQEDIPDFRLRRIIADSELMPLVEALRQHYPSVMKPLEEGNESAARAALGGLCTSDSADKFVRLARWGLQASGAGSQGQVTGVGGQGQARGGGTSGWYQSLCRELEQYGAAVERLLGEGKVAEAAVASKVTAKLRAELRANPITPEPDSV